MKHKAKVKRCNWQLIGLVVLLSSMSSGWARAEDAAPRLFVQARARDVSPDDAASMLAVTKALRAQGFLMDTESMAGRMDFNFIVPHADDPLVDDVTLRARMIGGILNYNQARFAAATKELSKAVRAYWRNPTVYNSNVPIADAYLALAVSYQKLGDELNAQATMKELVRGFSLSGSALASFGPSVTAFYKSVERAEPKQEYGRLQIMKTTPQPQVFVDGVFIATGDGDRIIVPEVKTGICHIVLRQSGSAGNFYEMKISAGSTVGIDERGASEVLWNPDWVGWKVAPDTSIEALGARAASLAQRLHAAAEVIVLYVADPLQAPGRLPPLAIGAFDASGKLRRSNAIDSNFSAEKMAEVMEFIIGGTAPPSAVTTKREPKASSHLGAKLLVAGGAALVITGGVLFALDEDPTTKAGVVVKPYYFDSAPVGVVAASVGAAAVGIGLWLWLRDDSKPSRSTAALHRWQPTVAVHNQHVMLGWAGRF
jgi:hypothetical protein